MTRRPVQQFTLLALLGVGFAADGVAAELFDAALRQEIQAVRIVADVQRFEPRQSINAMGAPIHTSDYSVDVTWQPANARRRTMYELAT